MDEYHICAACKHFAHNVIERGSGRYEECSCKLDASQRVYLFTPCKIGKWEAKDDPA